MDQNWKQKIREICTYHSEGGTSGYNLSEKQFSELEDLIKELLTSVVDEFDKNTRLVFSDRYHLTETGKWFRKHETGMTIITDENLIDTLDLCLEIEAQYRVLGLLIRRLLKL